MQTNEYEKIHVRDKFARTNSRVNPTNDHLIETEGDLY